MCLVSERREGDSARKLRPLSSMCAGVGAASGFDDDANRLTSMIKFRGQSCWNPRGWPAQRHERSLVLMDRRCHVCIFPESSEEQWYHVGSLVPTRHAIYFTTLDKEDGPILPKTNIVGICNHRVKDDRSWPCDGFIDCPASLLLSLDVVF